MINLSTLGRQIIGKTRPAKDSVSQYGYCFFHRKVSPKYSKTSACAADNYDCQWNWFWLSKCSFLNNITIRNRTSAHLTACRYQVFFSTLRNWFVRELAYMNPSSWEQFIQFVFLENDYSEDRVNAMWTLDNADVRAHDLPPGVAYEVGS